MGGMGAGPFLLHFEGQFIRRLGNGVKVEDVGRRGASQKRDDYECNEIHLLSLFVGGDAMLAVGERKWGGETQVCLLGARGVAGTFDCDAIFQEQKININR